MPFTIPDKLTFKKTVVDETMFSSIFEQNLKTIVACTYFKPDDDTLLKAIIQVRKLAQQKHVKSLVFLADTHSCSNIRFISTDIPTAQRLYLKALRIGIQDKEIAGHVYFRLYRIFEALKETNTAIIFLKEAAKLDLSKAWVHLSMLDTRPNASREFLKKACKLNNEVAIREAYGRDIIPLEKLYKYTVENESLILRDVLKNVTCLSAGLQLEPEPQPEPEPEPEPDPEPEREPEREPEPEPEQQTPKKKKRLEEGTQLSTPPVKASTDENLLSKMINAKIIKPCGEISFKRKILHYNEIGCIRFYCRNKLPVSFKTINEACSYFDASLADFQVVELKKNLLELQQKFGS